MNCSTPKPARGIRGPSNPARRRFVARLSKTATAAVPLAMMASVGLPKVQAGY